MDDNAGNTTVVDSVGGHNGTAQRNTSAFYTVGKINGDLNFNGSTDYVGTTIASGLSGDFTISSWVYPTAHPSNNNTWIASEVSSYGNYYISFSGDAGGTKALFAMYDGSNNPQATSVSNLPINTWTHIVGVRAAGKLKIYFNGQYEAQADDTIALTPSYSAFNIGEQVNHSRVFAGPVDDVRVYNKALKPDEVRALYNSSYGTQLDNNGSFKDNEALLANLSGGYDSSKTYWWKWYKGIDLNATTLITNGLVGYWPLDNDINDYGGSGNNGSCSSNCPTQTSAGKVGEAYSFDGTNGGFIVDSPNTLPTSNLTVCEWIKSSAPSDFRLTTNIGIGSQYQDLYMGTHNGKYTVSLTSGECDAYSTTPADFGWHFLCAKMDTVLSLYLDGNYEGQVNCAGPLNSTRFRLGTWDGGSYLWEGLIDEVQIYNRALSSTEISELYYGGLYDGNRMGAERLISGDSWKVGYQSKSLGGSWSADTNSAAQTIHNSGHVEVLVVAGGGGGGANSGGGGGGGGLIYNASFALSTRDYNITIGNGGVGGAGAGTDSAGKNGANSIFDSLIAIGGGGGASYYQVSTSGGSGGGGSSGSGYTAGASGTAGQGNSGGNGVVYDGGSKFATGGGGGWSLVGANGTTTPKQSGNGGTGYASTISGSSVSYGGGGGGGGYQPWSIFDGNGTDGGGNGGYLSNSNGSNGVANTGGGGGGNAGGGSGIGGTGGSGVVIIRYLTGSLTATDVNGTVTTDSAYTVHTFNSNGTFTVQALQ